MHRGAKWAISIPFRSCMERRRLKKNRQEKFRKKAQYKGCKKANVYTYFKVKVDFSE